MSRREDEARSAAVHFRTKLPTELCDIIYAYIWDKDTVQALQRPILLRPCYGCGVRKVQSCPCKILSATVPFIVNKDIVGSEVAAEALRWLYQNSFDLEIGTPEQFLDFFTETFLDSVSY